VETVNDKSYPIARSLYIYSNGQPKGVLKAYLDWVLTDGQEQVLDLGFVPLQANSP
jgi:phosphate transport system substrate-binding protein